MRKKLWRKWLAAALAGAMVLGMTACGGGSGSGDTGSAKEADGADDAGDTDSTADTGGDAGKGGKVAIIYTVTGKGDLSFNDSAYKGAKRAEEELGIQLVEVEPTSLSDTEQAFEEMSAEGDYDLIIGLTYEPLDAIAAVAPNYPDQNYALIDTDAGQDNVESYIARENESAFLAGCFAALMQQETNPLLNDDKKVIGIVPALDADVPNRHVAGYTCGAKFIDPEVEVMVDYVGDFSDTAAAQAIAETMYNNGADIIYHVAAGAGLGVFKTAEDNQFMAIGLDDNQNYLNPDVIGMSTLKMVDEFVYTAIEDALNGNFKGGEVMSMGLKEGGVSYTFDDSNVEVPQTVKDTMEEIKEMIINGDIEVPSKVADIDGFSASYTKK